MYNAPEPITKVYKIPIRSHLKELAIRDTFNNKTEPFLVTERSFLGKYVLGIFNDKRKTIPDHFIDDKEYNTIEIELSDTLAKRSPTYYKLQVALHEYFDHLFKEKMKTWCRAQLKVGKSSYAAAESFFHNYELDNSSDAFNANYEYLRSHVKKPIEQP